MRISIRIQGKHVYMISCSFFDFMVHSPVHQMAQCLFNKSLCSFFSTQQSNSLIFQTIVGQDNDSYYTSTGRTLGQGSFCEVKELILNKSSSAESAILPCFLALKQTRNDSTPKTEKHAAESLENEIRLLSTTNHSNIITIM